MGAVGKGLWIFLLIFYISNVESCGRGSISISDNGYQNIVVAISDRVEPNNEIIERIKTVFTEASAFLYEATRNRTYFQDITILLPSTWPPNSSYELPVDETLDKSDIVINVPEDGQGNRPFTIKTTPCGEPGYYMHLTPEYLLDQTVASEFGEYARVLIQEWAHLRYGVFNEYPSENGGQHFYADPDGYMEGTRCSLALTGGRARTDGGECQLVNGLLDESCRFVDEESLDNRYASLMYRTTLNHLSFFCDNETDNDLERHNPLAPNQQNIMCAGRSIWEVLRSHPDFADGANPPREIDNTDPTFTIVRQTVKQTVLVLDVSEGSDAYLDKINQGARTFISSIVQDGEEVGIVTFAEIATIDANLTTISNVTRQELLDALPLQTDGTGRSIGAGIQSGLQALNYMGAEPGTLVVVSVGEEDTNPLISEIEDEVLASGVTIHSIFVTEAADSGLEDLAQATGGLSFFASQNDDSNAITEAFMTIGDLDIDPSERSNILYSSTIAGVGTTPIRDAVIIDSTLGRGTRFIFDYSEEELDILLISPSGTQYTCNTTSVECEQGFLGYTFTFPDSIETGSWQMNVSSVSGTQEIAVTVVSKSSSPGEYPITAQAFWGTSSLDLSNTNPDTQTIYASVSKGLFPVLKAVVSATVQRPTGDSVEVMLRDDGSGADVSADDGVYSAYFIQFTSAGRYGVTITVDDGEETVISPSKIIGSASIYNVEAQDDQPTGDFQRLANGGSFEIINYQIVTYPPARIQDLSVTEVGRVEREVTLEWTAPGAQLDQGTLSRYNIRYGNDYNNLRDIFDNQTQVTQDMVVNEFNISNPQAPGMREILVLTLPTADNFTFYFSIKGQFEDSMGPLSNIVSATMRDIFPEEEDERNLPAIIGISLAIALVVVMIVTFIIFGILPKICEKDTINDDTSKSS